LVDSWLNNMSRPTATVLISPLAKMVRHVVGLISYVCNCSQLFCNKRSSLSCQNLYSLLCANVPFSKQNKKNEITMCLCSFVAENQLVDRLALFGLSRQCSVMPGVPWWLGHPGTKHPDMIFNKNCEFITWWWSIPGSKLWHIFQCLLEVFAVINVKWNSSTVESSGDRLVDGFLIVEHNWQCLLNAFAHFAASWTGCFIQSFQFSISYFCFTLFFNQCFYLLNNCICIKTRS